MLTISSDASATLGRQAPDSRLIVINFDSSIQFGSNVRAVTLDLFGLRRPQGGKSPLQTDMISVESLEIWDASARNRSADDLTAASGKSVGNDPWHVWPRPIQNDVLGAASELAEALQDRAWVDRAERRNTIVLLVVSREQLRDSRQGGGSTLAHIAKQFAEIFKADKELRRNATIVAFTEGLSEQDVKTHLPLLGSTPERAVDAIVHWVRSETGTSDAPNQRALTFLKAVRQVMDLLLCIETRRSILSYLGSLNPLNPEPALNARCIMLKSAVADAASNSALLTRQFHDILDAISDGLGRKRSEQEEKQFSERISRVVSDSREIVRQAKTERELIDTEASSGAAAKPADAEGALLKRLGQNPFLERIVIGREPLRPPTLYRTYEKMKDQIADAAVLGFQKFLTDLSVAIEQRLRDDRERNQAVEFEAVDRRRQLISGFEQIKVSQLGTAAAAQANFTRAREDLEKALLEVDAELLKYRLDDVESPDRLNVVGGNRLATDGSVNLGSDTVFEGLMKAIGDLPVRGSLWFWSACAGIGLLSAPIAWGLWYLLDPKAANSLIPVVTLALWAGILGVYVHVPRRHRLEASRKVHEQLEALDDSCLEDIAEIERRIAYVTSYLAVTQQRQGLAAVLRHLHRLESQSKAVEQHLQRLREGIHVASRVARRADEARYEKLKTNAKQMDRDLDGLLGWALDDAFELPDPAPCSMALAGGAPVAFTSRLFIEDLHVSLSPA
jgi:hypothetical protein